VILERPWLFAALSLLAALDLGCSPQPPDRPNVLFIMADDHALRAIGAYGSELIATPNIDRIANEGILFANSFVTNSICAPSRAVMLTGKYSHINGLRDNRDAFDGSQPTLPKLLRQAGYETAIVGKWHLKTEPTGFDDWRILTGQGRYYNPVFNENGEEVEHTGYVTDLITDQAIDFLGGRDISRPFALLYQHKAPHRNWMPASRHLDLYADHDLPVPETFYDDYAGRPAAAGQEMRVADMWLSLDMKLQPDYYGEETHYQPINEAFRDDPAKNDALAEWKYQRYLKDYLSTVAALDENVGRVLDYLDEHGLAEETIVIYTSDQGFYLGEHGWYDKRFMYEESLRMPLLMRYPASIAPGQTVDQLVLNLDFAPTLLDFAGAAIPTDMQGRSLRTLAEGSAPADWRDAIYYRYYEFPHGWHDVRPHYGIRTARHKLMHFTGDMDVWELYDLESDPHELRNLHGVEGYEALEEEMHSKLAALQLELRDSAEAQ
jgi:arylsulfatase A-like enzyme